MVYAPLLCDISVGNQSWVWKSLLAHCSWKNQTVTQAKMVLFLGDFNGRTPARRPLSREFNLSSRSHCSSYELNESLTQRDDLQVQLSHDDLQTWPLKLHEDSKTGTLLLWSLWARSEQRHFVCSQAPVLQPDDQAVVENKGWLHKQWLPCNLMSWREWWRISKWCRWLWRCPILMPIEYVNSPLTPSSLTYCRAYQWFRDRHNN